MFNKSISNRELARILTNDYNINTSYQTIGNYSSDKVSKLDTKIIDGIAKILDVDKEWILKGEGAFEPLVVESRVPYGEEEDSQIINSLKKQVDKLEQRLMYYKAENSFLKERLDKYDKMVFDKLADQKQEGNRKAGQFG